MKRLIAKLSPDQAKNKLIDGNERFINNKSLDSNDKYLFINKQNPFAIIITCSDSRVPPEIIFDQGLGDIFVIRVAGNVMDEVTMGSVEYAIEELDCSLIVVMGHDNCGAIKDALEVDKGDEDINSIIEIIKPSIEKMKNKVSDNELYEAVSTENIKNSIDELKKSKIINDKLKLNHLNLIGAKYFLESGKVKWIMESEIL